MMMMMMTTMYASTGWAKSSGTNAICSDNIACPEYRIYGANLRVQ